MKRKQGISLIVLVITIIVMVVLVAAVVVTLNNTGVIEKANQAVEDTNLKEVEQLANVVWAEEFMDGKRGESLKEAVLDRLKDYKDKYNIEVTDKGIEVNEKDTTVQPFDYFTYEYDTTNMTATVVGVKEEYAEYGYYVPDYGEQEQRIYSLTDEDGNKVTELVFPSKTVDEDGNVYAVTNVGRLLYFYYCDSIKDNCEITKVVIPNSVTELTLSSVFYNCSSLTSVTIPNSVTNIDGHFVNCANLSEIIYKGTIEEWQKIMLSPYFGNGAPAEQITCTNGSICVNCTGGTATCGTRATCDVCGNKYGMLGPCTPENGVCTICGKTVTVIESAHEPYAASQNYVVLGTWNYSDAKSVNITIEYQTEFTSCDWASITSGLDYVNGSGSSSSNYRDYLTTSGTIKNTYGRNSSIKFGGSSKTTKTFNNINMLTGSVVFRTDSSSNYYYGAKVTITPNY